MSTFSSIRGFPIAVIIFALLALASCNDTKVYVVQGSSMEPTYSAGDTVSVTTSLRSIDLIKRGDIVVLKSPVDGSSEWIRRVVGLPGDAVEWTNDGRLEIDRNPVGIRAPIGQQSTPLKLLLKSDEYYFLGDNLKNARDSREFGGIRKEEIVGIVK